MGESLRNEVFVFKNKIYMKYEFILFLYLFFLFKINIWFFDEFVKYFFNWIVGLFIVMWILEYGDIFRGNFFFFFFCG